jgi:hypothetical protein
LCAKKGHSCVFAAAPTCCPINSVVCKPRPYNPKHPLLRGDDLPPLLVLLHRPLLKHDFVTVVTQRCFTGLTDGTPLHGCSCY